MFGTCLLRCLRRAPAACRNTGASGLFHLPHLECPLQPAARGARPCWSLSCALRLLSIPCRQRCTHASASLTSTGLMTSGSSASTTFQPAACGACVKVSVSLNTGWNKQSRRGAQPTAPPTWAARKRALLQGGTRGQGMHCRPPASPSTPPVPLPSPPAQRPAAPCQGSG